MTSSRRNDKSLVTNSNVFCSVDVHRGWQFVVIAHNWCSKCQSHFISRSPNVKLLLQSVVPALLKNLLSVLMDEYLCFMCLAENSEAPQVIGMGMSQENSPNIIDFVSAF